MEKDDLIDAVRDYLDANDWHYEYDPERRRIHAGLNLNCKLKKAKLHIHFRETSYCVYIVLDLNADNDVLPQILKYTAMANYGLPSGNFEVDVSDGEIRYKTYVDANGLDALSKQVIEGSIYRGWNNVDRYGNGLAALLMGFSDPETEIEKAEKDD